MSASPLQAMEAVRYDPLYYVRNRVKGVHGYGIYQVHLMPGAEWATCYIEDESVPRTRAFKRRDKQLTEAFGFLDDAPMPRGAAARVNRGAAR